MKYVLEDFLEEEYKTLSRRELQEVERIKQDFYRIQRSFLSEKLAVYVLPFINQEI